MITAPEPSVAPDHSVAVERERTKRAKIAIGGALLLVFFALWALVFKPVWPMAIGVVVLAGMGGFVCWLALRK